jgi:DNA-binding protein YbaB
MDATSQELIKAKIIQAKTDLENKAYEYLSVDENTKINLQYSCILNQINYRGELLDSELIAQINLAINEAKKKMGEEYSLILAGMGIKF